MQYGVSKMKERKKSKKEIWLDSFPILEESDFLPPNDSRILQSGVISLFRNEYQDFLQDFFEYIYDYN